MEEIVIERMKPDEADEAAEVLSRAFMLNPFTVMVMGGGGEKNRRGVNIGMKTMITKKPGEVYVARENGSIVGVMRIVKWPDCQNSAPRGIEWLLPMLFMPGPARRLRRFRKKWGEHDPKEPHWHLDPLGVLPEKMGQGIGSKMLRYYCALVDESGLPAWHETDTPDNVRLYERFGFKVVSKEPNLGMTNWYLRREAR